MEGVTWIWAIACSGGGTVSEAMSRPRQNRLNQSSAAGPVGARPVRAVVGDGQDGTLKLSVESRSQQPAPAKSRVKEAGFDPYESTGGYRKPRGWDDVPRK